MLLLIRSQGVIGVTTIRKLVMGAVPYTNGGPGCGGIMPEVAWGGGMKTPDLSSRGIRLSLPPFAYLPHGAHE